MRREIRDAEDRLLSILRPMGQAVVAYSGGVDSALLATAARRVLGDRAVAITILSPTLPPGRSKRRRASPRNPESATRSSV